MFWKTTLINITRFFANIICKYDLKTLTLQCNSKAAYATKKFYRTQFIYPFDFALNRYTPTISKRTYIVT